jgi:hypothetical protein
MMYFRKAMLDHHPIGMIKKMGTPARYIAIAEPLPIEYALYI